MDDPHEQAKRRGRWPPGFILLVAGKRMHMFLVLFERRQGLGGKRLQRPLGTVGRIALEQGHGLIMRLRLGLDIGGVERFALETFHFIHDLLVTLIQRGRSQLEAASIAPTRTIETLKDDAEWAKDQTR